MVQQLAPVTNPVKVSCIGFSSHLRQDVLSLRVSSAGCLVLI